MKHIVKDFLVLHYSNNNLYNPQTFQFESEKKAREYVEEFQTKNPYHKQDEYLIVQVLGKGEIKQKFGWFRF